MTSQTRLHYLDNLRYLAVWSVVLFHASVGYIGLPEYFIETETTAALRPLRHAITLFNLPLMMMIAGYFFMPTLEHRGSMAFLRRKMLRLGLPFLIGIFFIGPLMPYMGYYSQSFNGLATDSYWDFWVHYMSSGLEWLGPIVFTTNPKYHQQHFYYLAALMQWMLVAVVVRAAVLKLARQGTGQPKTGRRSMGLVFLLVAFALAIVHFFISQLPGTAYVVAVIFYYSLGDFVLFGGAFLLGIYAYRRRWFLEGAKPTWVVTLTLISIAVLFHQGDGLLQVYRGEVNPSILTFSSELSTSLTTWMCVAIVLWIGTRWLNHSTRFHREMAASSYDIYLLQYPVILALRLPLLTWQAPAMLKWFIVVVGTIAICWALSRFLIRPRPRTTLVLVLAGHVLLSVFGPPRSGDSHLLLDRRAELLHVIPKPEGGQRVSIADTQRTGRARQTLSLASNSDHLLAGMSRAGLTRVSGKTASPVIEGPVGDLAVDSKGRVFAVLGADGGHIGSLDRQAGVPAWQVLPMTPATSSAIRFLQPAGQDLVYFTSDDGALRVRQADGTQRKLSVPEQLKSPNGLAMTADGTQLLVTDAKGVMVWAFAIARDGSLGPGRQFGELFRGDRRYGEHDKTPISVDAEAIAIHDTGYVFVATRPGVQVFDPRGRLLGLATFPELLPYAYYPPRPRDLAFAGPGGATLFVANNDQLFAIDTLLYRSAPEL